MQKTKELKEYSINSESKNKICAVIPFYNEEGNIKRIIGDVLTFVNTVIAVNDGSTDESLSKIVKSTDVIVLSHDVNLGKGAALRSGFLKSIDLKTNITITIDADGQHDPGHIPAFIEAVRDSDIVIGNRMRNKGSMPYHRRLSNYLTSKILSLKTGNSILDSQCGFRAYKTKVLSSIIPQSSGFEAESEMIIRASRKNYKISFVGIPAVYGNEKSKMNNLGATVGFIKTIMSKYD